MAEPPDDVKPPVIGPHPKIYVPRPAATPPPAAPPTKEFFLNPAFKLSLICVAGFTFLAFVTNVALAVFAPPSDEVKALIETCAITYQTGFGALVGLIGGKAL